MHTVSLTCDVQTDRKDVWLNTDFLWWASDQQRPVISWILAMMPCLLHRAALPQQRLWDVLLAFIPRAANVK